MKGQKVHDKSELTIRLIEPVVYLKGAGVSGRRRARNEPSQPSMIRGVLNLHLSEPRKICSIGIQLTAKSFIRLPDGMFPILNYHLTDSPARFLLHNPRK